MSGHQKFTHTDVHRKLIDRYTPGFNAEPERQAYNCPYYVPLSGVLGSDWGVCCNPISPKFGLLVFEHDDCGCLGDCPRGNQRPNQWVRREAGR